MTVPESIKRKADSSSPAVILAQNCSRLRSIARTPRNDNVSLMSIPLKLFHGVEDFGGVALGGRFVPDFGDAAVGPDQERGTHDPEEGFAEELLHAPRAISFDGLEFRIAQYREI
jgi:hypothetical protein